MGEELLVGKSLLLRLLRDDRLLDRLLLGDRGSCYLVLGRGSFFLSFFSSGLLFAGGRAVVTTRLIVKATAGGTF